MTVIQLASRIMNTNHRIVEPIPLGQNGLPLTLFLSILILTFPNIVESFHHKTPLFSFLSPLSHHTISQDPPADVVSITQLLSEPNLYHKTIIKVRGTVTQPELHVDESGLFIRFVFVLKDAEDTLIVFGHHDRTQGNIQIETNEKVEVIGIFWKERTANDHHFQNNLEAITVTRYPPLHPDAA